MVFGLTLGEDVPFDVVYRPRFLIMKDGKHVYDIKNQIFSPDVVRLWRYDLRRTGSVRQNCYWSELETEYPQLSGEATGIGDGECVWRAEWRFPTADAVDKVYIGNQRWSACGVFREFMNIQEIPEENLIWTQMRNINGARPT